MLVGSERIHLDFPIVVVVESMQPVLVIVVCVANGGDATGPLYRQCRHCVVVDDDVVDVAAREVPPEQMLVHPIHN